MSLLSDKELDDYCMQALNVPLMGISQLVSMVILHFNVSDNEADKLVLAWLLKLVTKCEAQHAKDQENCQKRIDSFIGDAEFMFNEGHFKKPLELIEMWQALKAKIKEE